MKVFCQSTTPASDSCRAQTEDGDMAQRSRKEAVQSGRRRYMTQLDPKLVTLSVTVVSDRDDVAASERSSPAAVAGTRNER